MHTIGLVLHPQRDSAEAVAAVLEWAAGNGAQVLGIGDEIKRLNCAATAVSASELGRRSDLLVSLGGDGTMLRAMRLADGHRGPVLGVNLGKLGFLAEVDVPELPGALSAIDRQDFTIEPRLAIDATIGPTVLTAFNDVAVVRVPGQGGAVVAVRVGGQPFVSYAADAVIAATPAGSTAYSFSAGGPIISPAVEALLITPAAPHSAYNRGLVLSVTDTVTLELLPSSGRLAIEVDGQVSGYADAGQCIDLRARPGGARVVRLGQTTFYQRARRKLRITDSAEIPAPLRRGADTTDALTAVPLGVAFVLSRRPPTRRYTYGYGRAEDLAGIAAALVGFAGNELAARYRIRTGRKIGSAALVADGLHARADGLASLAVLAGAGGVALGWNWLTPSSACSSPWPSWPSCARRPARSTGG